ncbi:MAG: BON domain-containing protein [Gammaproteobacteria bacterium]|nr:BON domain-containing protein [Gammaproteobacteria bacterium]
MELNFRRFAVRATAALAAALASAMVLGAGPSPDPDSADLSAASIHPSDAPQNAGDARVTQALNQRLNADPKHFFRHVNVSVQDGVAHLSGFVASADALNRAKTIASETPGVSRVVDEMKVMHNGNNGSQPD